MRSVVVALLCCTVVAAEAQVYKCEDAGRTVYQNEPCRGAGQSIKMNTVGEEIERRKRVKAEAEADQRACAEKFKRGVEVKNSPWDGSVYEVEQYLKSRVLKDPDSFQAIEWSRVVKGCGDYAVRLKYRARNSFGGYVCSPRPRG